MVALAASMAVLAVEAAASTVIPVTRTAGTRSSTLKEIRKIWMTFWAACSVECLEDMAERGEHPVPTEAVPRAAVSIVALVAVAIRAAASTAVLAAEGLKVLPPVPDIRAEVRISLPN